MPTEDAYSSGHLILSNFGTCKCSNVETNLSWTCLVSGLWVSKIPRYFCFACNGCGMPAENAYHSRHQVPPPPRHFGTCLFSNCWDQIPRTCHVFTRLFTSNTPRYFLDFAFIVYIYIFRAILSMPLEWLSYLTVLNIDKVPRDVQSEKPSNKVMNGLKSNLWRVTVHMFEIQNII